MFFFKFHPLKTCFNDNGRLHSSNSEINEDMTYGKTNQVPTIQKTKVPSCILADHSGLKQIPPAIKNTQKRTHTVMNIKQHTTE